MIKKGDTKLSLMSCYYFIVVQQIYDLEIFDSEGKEYGAIPIL
jgi:hypothetical protein